MLALKEGLRPTLSLEERRQQLERQPDRTATARDGIYYPTSLLGSQHEEEEEDDDQLSLGEYRMDNTRDDDDGLYNNLNFGNLHQEGDDDAPLNPHDSDNGSSVDFELGARINMSDTVLMMTDNEKGTLRLTKDGLKRHEQVQLEETVKSRRRLGSKTGFERWKFQQDTKKWYQSKHAQRDAQMHQSRLKKAFRGVGVGGNRTPKKPPPSNMGPLQTLGLVSVSKQRKLEKELGDVSVGPIDLEVTYVPPPSSSSGGIIRRKTVAELKQEYLDKERRKQREYEAQKEQVQDEEKERIRQRKRDYLERQRRLQSQRPPTPPSPLLPNVHIAQQQHDRVRDNNSSNNSDDRETFQDRFTSIGDSTGNRVVCSELPTNPPKTVVMVPSNSSSKKLPQQPEETFTVSTTASGLPCAVCSVGDRTHIAMPCMHYCFCEDCVQGPLRTMSRCPVCQRGGVSYTKVFY